MRESYAVASGRQGALAPGGLSPRRFVAIVLGAAVALGLIALAVSQLVGQVGSRPSAAPDLAKLKETYGKLPLAFEANRGQTDAQVKFLSRGAGYSLFLTPKEAVLSLQRGTDAPTGDKLISADADKRAVVRMRMLGANPSPQLAGVGRLQGESNYLVGKDQSKWKTGVESYRKVRYGSVYPGTDVVYYGRQGKLEYDFVLRPGADPGRIGLSFAGAKRVAVDRRGDLVLSTAVGKVRQQRPVVYQRHGNEKRRIAGSYVLKGRDRVGFSLGRYDRGKALVIDPVLEYSTYLGGAGGAYGDRAYEVAVDRSGSAYVMGYTSSPAFPTTPDDKEYKAFDTTLGGRDDVFVAKLNPAGSALEYSTYLGGSESESFNSGDIAVDGAGSAYVAGETSSNDFPTTGTAFQSGYTGGQDAFFAKLNPTGSALQYSTYLGGSRGDGGIAVGVDPAGAAYVTGRVNSSDFPTKNAFDTTLGFVTDTFVAKLDPSKSNEDSLVYSTYLGGDGAEPPYGLAVDPEGAAYVTGRTNSADFPTRNAFDATLGGADAFVAKVDPSRSGTESLVYSSYLGGDAGVETGTGIAVDDRGGAYITGETFSADFPTKHAIDPVTNAAPALEDGFVTKLSFAPEDPALKLDYSTFLGGSGDDEPKAIAVDSAGSAYVTGMTFSADFPTKDAFDSVIGGTDAFVTKLGPVGSPLGPAGDQLKYSTFLGSEGGGDIGDGIAVDCAGSAYVAGETTSPAGFPTKNPYQGANAGGLDAFLAKLSDTGTALSLSDATVPEGKKGQTTGATFTVSLTQKSETPVSVDVATADDSATAPDDYAPRGGTLTFAPGEQTKMVTVDVKGDNRPEPDERFTLRLLNPQGASNCDAEGIGTIKNDDGRTPS